MTFSIRGQTCPNERCVLYQFAGRGNIVLHGRAPRRIRCTACGKTWVAYRRELHYGLRSDMRQIHHAIALLRSGMSIRRIASSIDVSPTTVQRWKARTAA